MEEHTQVFVGIDVAKLRNAVAVADAGRDGEVRFLGEVDAGDESMRRIIRKIASGKKAHFLLRGWTDRLRTTHRLITSMGPRLHRGGTVAHSA